MWEDTAYSLLFCRWFYSSYLALWVLKAAIGEKRTVRKSVTLKLSIRRRWGIRNVKLIDPGRMRNMFAKVTRLYLFIRILLSHFVICEITFCFVESCSILAEGLAISPPSLPPHLHQSSSSSITKRVWDEQKFSVLLMAFSGGYICHGYISMVIEFRVWYWLSTMKKIQNWTILINCFCCFQTIKRRKSAGLMWRESMKNWANNVSKSFGRHSLIILSSYRICTILSSYRICTIFINLHSK